MDESSQGKYGFEVHGFWRDPPDEEWQPFKFLADDEEARTSLCDGTIRQLSQGTEPTLKRLFRA